MCVPLAACSTRSSFALFFSKSASSIACDV
jgi:hypothetical protein